MSNIFDLAASVSMEDEARRYTELREKGNNTLRGCCPIHKGDNPTSFIVYRKTNSFYCNACKVGGNTITFREALDKTDRLTAAKNLCHEYHIPIDGATSRMIKKRKDEKKIEDGKKNEELLSYANSYKRRAEEEKDTSKSEELREKAEMAEAALSVEFCEEDPDASLRVKQSTIDYLSDESGLSLSDFSDVAEGRLFAKEYGSRVLYSSAFGWMVYDNIRWKAEDSAARGLAQELTDRQLEFANNEIINAAKKRASASTGTTSEIEAADKAAKRADDFHKYIIKRRDTKRISATLTEAAPELIVDNNELDKYPYYLNTPAGTVNLIDGSMKPHDPKDYITSVTTYSPSSEGREIWEAFINRITEGDNDFAEFLQRVCGMSVVGEVLDEKLIICNGTGGNGKSTLFNALTITLGGGYAIPISSSVLIAQEGQAKRFELANLRGKRLVTAAETKAGEKLDESLIKTMTSTNDIAGEIKYKSPFTFRPSHHLILQTNHLPKVEGLDDGIWDRLLVLPFTARLRDTDSEIKNYSEYLSAHCGGAILQWLIDGARRFLEDGKLKNIPENVRTATEDYRDQYDTIHKWRVQRCNIGRGYMAGATELFQSFTKFSEENGEKTTISQREFGTLLEKAGYQRRKTGGKMQYRGISPKN